MRKEPITRDNCGSTRGYQKHYREGESPCKPCIEAQSIYTKKRMENPENKRKKAEENLKRRLANPEEYRRRAAISAAKRIDKKNARAREYHAENREEINRKLREYKKANPELISAQAAAYYQRNKDKIAAYRAMNREKAKAWRNANPELFRMYNRKRKAAKLNAPSEPYTSQQILDLYGTDCYLCHEPIDLKAPRRAGFPGWEVGLQIEHIVPLSKEGTDLISNVRPSHGLCNLNKHTTPLEVFVLQC